MFVFNDNGGGTGLNFGGPGEFGQAGFLSSIWLRFAFPCNTKGDGTGLNFGGPGDGGFSLLFKGPCISKSCISNPSFSEVLGAPSIPSASEEGALKFCFSSSTVLCCWLSGLLSNLNNNGFLGTGGLEVRFFGNSSATLSFSSSLTRLVSSRVLTGGIGSGLVGFDVSRSELTEGSASTSHSTAKPVVSFSISYKAFPSWAKRWFFPSVW